MRLAFFCLDLLIFISDLKCVNETNMNYYINLLRKKMHRHLSEREKKKKEWKKRKI